MNATIGAVGDVVPYPDHALYLALRGAGQAAVMQGLFVYDRPVDIDALRAFHRNLYHGTFGRLMEHPALPFGRLRWVAAPFSEANLTIYPGIRSRSELYDWADEQVVLPLDPEWGPAWRLGVQSFDDGSSVISMVVSHCIADGGGTVVATLAAINGVRRDMGYLPARSMTRRRALRRDLRQFVDDLPEVRRTLRRAAGVALRRRGDLAKPAAASVPKVDPRVAHVPFAYAIVDIADWDACAERLGGNSFSLVSGFAGRIASTLGRVRASDGAVTLMIPVNQRQGLDDTGGNVVSIANVSFDPAGVTEDLGGLRTAIRNGLRTAREVPDEMIELLPLIPFVPRRAFGKIADVTFGFSSDVPVSCSNLGDIPAECLTIDGSPAKYLCFRGVDREVTRGDLDRRGGLLTVASARVAGKIIVTVTSYQPGADNSQSRLRGLISDTLRELRLDGEIV